MRLFFFTLLFFYSTLTLAGGPFIDTSSIFGAKKLARDSSAQFSAEMEKLLDYFFDVKLEPFLETLNKDVKDGADHIDGLAEERINQINEMLIGLVDYASKTTFKDAEDFQTKFLDNAYFKMDLLSTKLVFELQELNKSIFKNIGCASNEFTRKIPLAPTTELQKIYDRKPEVFEQFWWGWFGENYKDNAGCFAEEDIDTNSELSPTNKLIVFICATEKSIDINASAKRVRNSYADLLMAASLTSCQVTGASNSEPYQRLIYKIQTDLLNRVALWEEFIKN